MDKNNALLDLAIKRKQTEPPTGSTRIGDYYNGIYECDYVSPFTRGANNVNAEIFVLLQDWSSHNDMIKPITDLAKQQEELLMGYTPNQRTNKKLKELLDRHFHITIADTYGTNLYPFVKPDDMSSFILQNDLEWAAEQFALPQIKIVAPKIVICLGIKTFNALRSVCGEKQVESVEEGINEHFPFNSASVWLQAHTGFHGQYNRNHGGVDKVNSDWEIMTKYFHSLS